MHAMKSNFFYPDFNRRSWNFTKSVPNLGKSRTFTAGKDFHLTLKSFAEGEGFEPPEV